MTAASKSNPGTRHELRPSLLPFDPADLMAMRVRPARFAGMCEVSKQTVSRWIKDGKISLGPDGLLDPVVASRQVFENTDPARLRARIFKEATATLEELRQRIRLLEASLAESQRPGDDRERTARLGAQDEAAHSLTRFLGMLEARFAEAVAANGAGTLADWLDELIAVEFYGQDVTEYRRLLCDDAIEVENISREKPTALRAMGENHGKGVPT